MKVLGTACFGVILLLSFLPSSAQESEPSLPRIVSAWAPLYPPLGRQARIQGAVILRVSTDGKRIVKFESESGPPLLVQAVKENTKTWEFEPHKPISFEVRFQYRLIGYHCDARCNCSGDEKESVLLQLPAYAELTTTLPMICDPAVPIEKK